MCFSNIYAQNEENISLWADYRHQKFITKYKVWWRNDVSIRHTFDDQHSTLYIYKTSLKLNILNSLEFLPGIDFRYNNISNYENILEIRTWQSLRLHWPNIGRFMFEHNYKFEERFFFYSNNLRNEDIGLRSRYRLSVLFPLNNKSIYDKTFFVNLSSEFFLSHYEEVDDLFAETVRLGFLFGYKQNEKWSYSFTFFADKGKTNLVDERTVNNYILSFTVKNTIDLNKNKKGLN